jgi:hypothetical protein
MKAQLPLLTLLVAACGGVPRIDPPLQLRIDNLLSTSVYLQRGACGVDSWVSVKDANGATVEIDRGACGSYCSEPRRPCPVEIACPAPMVFELKPNDQQTSLWDGNILTNDQKQGCLDRSLATGEYTATFCWGTTATASQFGEIQNPTCKSAPVRLVPSGGAELSTNG